MATVLNQQTFATAPIMSGASITSATIPIAAVVGTAMDLTTAQTVAGVKTFSSAPVMSGASITSATVPIAAVVGTAMDLTTAQTVAGIKTFSSAPVMSGASITSATVPIAAVVGTAMDLTTAQTVAGIKTFSSAPVMSGASITSGTIPLAALVGGAPDLPIVATVSTTDATVTTLISVALGTNSAVTIQGSLIGVKDDYSDITGGSFTATASRAGGSAALLGTPYVVVNATSTATFNATVVGNNLLVQVTGIVATNYSWRSEYNTNNL